MTPIANHLWQSTLFAGAVALLALALRGNRARTRYWLWLAASLKFLVPFSLLMSVGGGLALRPVMTARPVAAAVSQVGEVFLPLPAAPAEFSWLPVGLAVVWLLGFASATWDWRRSWRFLAEAKRTAAPIDITADIPVLSTPVMVEPGVFGIFRPVLLLPRGITEVLTPEQMKAIVTHELCHVRSRDNLASLGHMLVEAIFWFHPLVWWIGSRMVEERERACDEEVVSAGNRPEAYAEGILNVCRFYLQSPLPCASGVTGADLKQRVLAIMAKRDARRLTASRKLLLAGALLSACALPVFVGVVHGQGALAFDVVSIRPSEPGQQNSRFNIAPGGGINVSNVAVRKLIEFAFGFRATQVIGGPAWIETASYDIVARVDKGDGPADLRSMTNEQRDTIEQKIQQRTKALLEDRFKLVVKRDTREMPLMALTVAKGGLKIKPNPPGDARPPNARMARGKLTAQAVPMARLVQGLSMLLQQTVIDETSVTGEFDFELAWSPDTTPDADGPSIFTALQEKLGLKLESKKGPVPVIVIERVERPSEN